MKSIRLLGRTVLTLNLLGAVLGALTSLAHAVSIAGHLDPNNANDVFLFPFALSGASNLSIQSWGYGGTENAPGGTNAAGDTIQPGGFDPYLSRRTGG